MKVCQHFGMSANFSPGLQRVEAGKGCQAVGWSSAFGEMIKDLALYSGSSLLLQFCLE